ncbi:MAG: 50S ribosomal protein L25/general stress protein Ctc [Rhodospirillales bacterium]|nr:50S ribosomal protein L25/general stress protein Ctc [Alphaproteobacteria bacterium]MBL6947610.1 50S ribosomal protein L25/general stress protein Ctc [Rhodospirillales bacterium]
MAQSIALAAEARDMSGTGAARATRRAGRVPCIIYGNKEEPVLISIDPMDLQKQLRGPGFFARVFEIEVGGQKHRVLARDLQVDPVTDKPIHVDFMRFSASTRLNIDVQVIFENHEESPGIKRGGVLNVVRHTVEMLCNPDSIPESITVDLTGLDIGDSVHISSVELPGDVELTISDRDFTIATIAAPTLLVEIEEEGEEGVEEGEGVEGEEGEGEEAADGEEKAEGGEE